MRVELIQTEGYGGSAQIEVDGLSLVVLDAFSAPGEPASPGPIADAHFEVEAPRPESWERAFARNPGGEKKLEHLRGWRYVGFGQVVSVDPVRADLGALVLELDLHGSEEALVGRYLAVDLDRIALRR